VVVKLVMWKGNPSHGRFAAVKPVSILETTEVTYPRFAWEIAVKVHVCAILWIAENAGNEVLV